MSDIGYECGECGYTPTDAELRRGTCPNCRPRLRDVDETFSEEEIRHASLRDAKREMRKVLDCLQLSGNTALSERGEALLLDIHNEAKR